MPSLLKNNPTININGPSINTLKSLTWVAINPASFPITNEAATTCGTAYTDNPAITPYWNSVIDKAVNSKGRKITWIKPIAALKLIAEATRFGGDFITEAIAAIAEFPQIEFPVATNIDTVLSSFKIVLQSKNIRVIPKNTEITDIDINDSPLSLTIEKFILNPKRITANSSKFLETNFGALSSLEKKLGIF